MSTPATGHVERRQFVQLGLAGALASLGLAACASPGEASSTQSPSVSLRPEPDSALTAPRVLVAYFSRPGENYWYGERRTVEVGFTHTLAEMISDRIECDLFQIRAADPYAAAYDPTVQRNHDEQTEGARPRIRGALPDLRRYDTMLLGSPVWNVRSPMIMSTFVESLELSGKRILPFVTHAISGMAGIDDAYRRALPQASVADGLAVRGEEVRDGGPALDRWLATHL